MYTQTEKWQELEGVIGKLIEIFNKLSVLPRLPGVPATIALMPDVIVFNRNDPVKLAESIHKKIDLSRTHLKPSLLPSLALLLPSSPYAATLSDLPLPEPTAPGAKPSTITNVQHVVHTLEGGLDLLEEIVKGWEKEELEVRSKEIEKRRTRITGARAKTRSQIEREVFAEFAEDSHLPDLYSQLLNHPSLSVERLREVEHALLLHHRTLLFSISSKDKEAKRVERKKVQELSQGVVLIRGADRDAWEAQLEWADWTSIGPCDHCYFLCCVDADLSCPASSCRRVSPRRPQGLHQYLPQRPPDLVHHRLPHVLRTARSRGGGRSIGRQGFQKV